MIDGVELSKSSVVLTAYLVIVLLSCSVLAEDQAAITSNDRVNHANNDFWQSFISQAKVQGLPTQFLLAMDPDARHVPVGSGLGASGSERDGC